MSKTTNPETKNLQEVGKKKEEELKEKEEESSIVNDLFLDIQKGADFKQIIKYFPEMQITHYSKEFKTKIKNLKNCSYSAIKNNETINGRSVEINIKNGKICPIFIMDF